MDVKFYVYSKWGDEGDDGQVVAPGRKAGAKTPLPVWANEGLVSSSCEKLSIRASLPPSITPSLISNLTSTLPYEIPQQ